MNSETRMPACLSVCTTGLSCARWPDRVEPAFGGALGALFRHQADRVRLGRERDRHHLLGRRHFEIERLVDLRLQPRDVVVADVAAILAQMRGDAVAAGRDRELGRAHRIGMAPAARVADGGDVIDIDAEARARRSHSNCPDLNRAYPFTRSAFATTGLARNCAMMAVRCLRS